MERVIEHWGEFLERAWLGHAALAPWRDRLSHGFWGVLGEMWLKLIAPSAARVP